MSREYNLHSNLVEVKKGNREDLLSALASMGDCDCDFNGENGVEYLWDEVWKANGFENMKDYEEQNEYDSDEDEDYEEIKLKYESNLEYLLDKVKDIKSDIECINEFFNIWMEKDKNYYHDYNVDYLTDENEKIYAIAFSVMAGY